MRSFQLRTALRKHAAHARIAICGTRVYTDPQVVTQELASGERRARWSGVVLCGRAGCPVCSETKARKFGDRVRRTLSAGGLWQHVIFTLSHGPRDSWSYTYDRLLDGVHAMTKGGAGRLLAGLVEATIRSSETTWSVRAGWHVHFHVLWRVRRSVLPAERELLAQQWSSQTGASVEHGLRFGACFDCDDPSGSAAAASYVSKLAHEMSGEHKRAHREHFTLGEIYQRAAGIASRPHEDGDEQGPWIDVVRSYQTATHGRRLYQLDRRAKAIHDQAPELPELVVLHEWRTTIERAEFSGLSRCERFHGEPLACYLPLEAAAKARGDPSELVGNVVTDLLQAFDSETRQRAPLAGEQGSEAGAAARGAIVISLDFARPR